MGLKVGISVGMGVEMAVGIAVGADVVLVLISLLLLQCCGVGEVRRPYFSAICIRIGILVSTFIKLHTGTSLAKIKSKRRNLNLNCKNM